jgi:hypothetical protein
MSSLVEVKVSGFSAAAKMAHLSDGETVASGGTRFWWLVR